MWKFRPIGKYYELLVDGDSVYLCRKQDTIIQAVIEELCNRHNTEMAKYENLDVEIVSCDEAYLNGLEDGKEEAAQERYDAGYDEGYQIGKTDGYDLGYRRGLADAIACEDKLT
jgi:flagellar biosynthesis/type III secretory pathway protein FliH